ncbi:MAG: CpaF family protein [Deltaproteobacteria bacterium]|nr:CpaF family protein [Deltaproteobacteria bacterium]
MSRSADKVVASQDGGAAPDPQDGDNNILSFLTTGSKRTYSSNKPDSSQSADQSRTSRHTQSPSNHGQFHQGHAAGGLSFVASQVLREARREIGHEFQREDGIVWGAGVAESRIASAVDKVLKKNASSLPDIERAHVIIHLQKDLEGWGVLQPLIDNQDVTDIHVYDYRTVVLQRGKVSEFTGLMWPNQQAYSAFVDRLLLTLGKSLSTQQHTVDASFPDGIRVCAVHESACATRGPLLTVRIPRFREASLDNLVAYQLAPARIIDYLSAIVRSGALTMMVSGETGTGKTTLVRCLGSVFGSSESIVTVEDTPELNFNHPFCRALVSRPPNSEGIGEITLQEHIKTTLRMTPTRVVLGEMRTPLAAEAFLESAQTGHVGLSTIHARNAKETLTRLESLLGRAQKSVSIEIIRQQIALALDVVVWMFREKGSGIPRIGEVLEVGNFSEGNVQVRPIFRYDFEAGRPVWKVESWSSLFQEVLLKHGIHLGDLPQELTCEERKLSTFSSQRRN